MWVYRDKDLGVGCVLLQANDVSSSWLQKEVSLHHLSLQQEPALQRASPRLCLLLPLKA